LTQEREHKRVDGEGKRSGIAPGPRLRVITQLSALRRDPLGFMQRAHDEYGDIVRLGGGAATVHLLAHPDHADHVLRKHHDRYDRDTRSGQAMELVTGESILTTSGDAWRTRRLLLQPTFNHDSVASLGELILDETRPLLERWATTSGAIDVAKEMAHLTLAIASRAFFGTELHDDVAEVAALMPPVVQRTYERSTALIPMHRLLRSARDRRFDERIHKLQEVVRKIIDQNLVKKGQLLTRLVDARFEDGSTRLTPSEVANETLALLLAGHETTANTLTWLVYFLTRHPEVMATLTEEIRHEATGPITTETASRLPYLSAVINETMRLAPSIWIIERKACVDDEINGFEIPEGSVVYVSPWVLHRRADYWEEPEAFRPERFIGVSGRNPAFLPFGAGPHHCLGSHFALLEMKLVVASMLQRFNLIALRSNEIAAQAWITLRPASRVEVKVTPRRDA
jgi:enediyne biosynthesis protein E7